MTRAPLWHRLATAFLAALFLAAGAERAFGLAHCAHHDATFPAPASTPAGDHAAHGDHSDGDGQGAGPCTCVGTCQLLVAQAGPHGSATSIPAPPPEWRAGTAAAGDPRPALTLTLLPYSTAPPAGR
jgi:hypothetical protein